MVLLGGLKMSIAVSHPAWLMSSWPKSGATALQTQKPMGKMKGLKNAAKEIADRFEEKTDRKQRQADDVEPCPPYRLARHLDVQQRHPDHPEESTLQPEDHDQRPDREDRGPPFAHGGVTIILALAKVSLGEVTGQSQTPQGRENRDQQASRRHGSDRQDSHPGNDYEAEAPKNVNDARIPYRQADKPKHQHDARNETQV